MDKICGWNEIVAPDALQRVLAVVPITIIERGNNIMMAAGIGAGSITSPAGVISASQGNHSSFWGQVNAMGIAIITA